MSLFDDLPAIIADVLADESLGFATVVLTHVEPGAYDPSTGTVSPDVTYTATVRAVPEDYKGLSLLPGTQVQAGDKKVTVAAVNVIDDVTRVAFRPAATKTTATVGGVGYAVIAAPEVAPGSSAVIYELQCRKA